MQKYSLYKSRWAHILPAQVLQEVTVLSFFSPAYDTLDSLLTLTLTSAFLSFFPGQLHALDQV
jgi:hypothetical protein